MIKQIFWSIITIVALFFIHNIFSSMNQYFLTILIYIGINIILAVSLNLVNGFTGQFSLGHAGFMAVGGYVSAVFTSFVFKYFETGFFASLSGSVFFMCALIIGGLISTLLGYLVGLPSLRLKDDYLAIVTLGFGEIIRVIILNIEAVGGARGFINIPKYSNFFWVYFWVVITVFVIWRIINSTHGRALMAIREDEIAASCIGIDTTKYKVIAFMIASFFAGIAGGLFAHFLSYLNPSTFSFIKSIEIVIMVVLGGMGSITGSIFAAIIITILPEILRPLQIITHFDFRMVIYSLILIIFMLTKPTGLFGGKELKLPFKRKI
jgi:branched-chain amino acid transport system permease protein